VSWRRPCSKIPRKAAISSPNSMDTSSAS